MRVREENGWEKLRKVKQKRKKAEKDHCEACLCWKAGDKLYTDKKEAETAKVEVTKPFTQEAELAEKTVDTE